MGTVLNTTTLHNVEILWTGSITYTPDIDYWSPASYYLTYQASLTPFQSTLPSGGPLTICVECDHCLALGWTEHLASRKLFSPLYFSAALMKLTQGGGTLNANGQVWWNYLAVNGSIGVAGGSSRQFARPVPLTLYNAKVT